MEDIEKIKAQLEASGLSQPSIEGIKKLAAAAHASVDKSDKEAIIAGVKKLVADIGEFMKTQSAEDQALYEVIIEKKKAEFRAAQAAQQ